MSFLARAVMISAAGIAACLAQPAETFEVASIKLGDPTSNGTSFSFLAAGGLRVQGATLKALITFAYDIREFQLTGATGWINGERYDILAKGERYSDGPAEYGKMNDAQRRSMAELIRKRMQALLAERFQLTLHRETKELPTYALVIAKNGVKMQVSNLPDGSPQSMSMGNAMYRGKRASLDGIVHGLSSLLGRPVENQTGLKGFYDFDMKWTPDASAAGPGGPEEKQLDAFGPTLFTAIQEQMGLKLEPKKGPVEILVIDRAERASEN